jgi:SHS2 domain-containing protein
VAVESATAPEGVRFIEHTADFGLEVEAPSLEECFARVAAGLFSSFAEEAPAAGPAPRTVELTLSASSLEELLVLWLEELLYRTETERLAFRAFKVDAIEGLRLHGWAKGVPGAGEPPIKGVTRHDLSVRRVGDVWRAHVILDV